MPLTNSKGISVSQLGGLVNPLSYSYGLTWADLGVITASGPQSMAYLGNGIALMGDASNRIWRSTDYGATWINLQAASGVVYAIASLGNGIVVLGDSGNHVWRSTDYGASWTDLGVITASFVRSLSYLGNGVVILGENTGHIWRSTNYGATWADLGVISAGNAILCFTTLVNGIALMGDSNGHAWRSTDYGATWSDRGATSAVAYSLAYLGDGIAILGANGGIIWRSTNYGLNWVSLGAVAGAPMMAAVYLGGGIALMGDNNGHIWRSTDYGNTWTDLAVGGNGVNVFAYLENGIVVLGDNANHVWRSTSGFGNDNFFNPNQFDIGFQFGCLGAITPNNTTYLYPGNGATTLNETKIVAPRAGLLKNLYVFQRVASGGGGLTDIYTVMVNGVATTITCTLNNATSGSDITHSVWVAAGAQISLKLVSNNAADTSADVTASLGLI